MCNRNLAQRDRSWERIEGAVLLFVFLVAGAALVLISRKVHSFDFDKRLEKMEAHLERIWKHVGQQDEASTQIQLKSMQRMQNEIDQLKSPHVFLSRMDFVMEQEAFRAAKNALSTHGNDFVLAALHIREAFDAKFGKRWHCLVVMGNNFGAALTHAPNCYVKFRLHNNVHVELFRTSPAKP